MKKLIFLSLSLFLFAGVATAQVTGKKAYNKAVKALAAYNTDSKATDKLDEAIEMINTALEDEATASTTKAWNKKGEIYNAASQHDVKALILDPAAKPMYPTAGMEAYKAYSKLLSLAEKKWDKKSAIDGLTSSAQGISNTGVAAYEAQDYATAFEAFKTVLAIHKTINDNGGESAVLATEEDYNNQLYITGLAALQADKVSEGTVYYQELYDKKYDKPAVYEALSKIKMQDDQAAGIAILEEGRKLFPDDVSLLFAEINYYLKENKLDLLVGKLQDAIKKEPDNVSLYSTLGNVYDNLFQRELEAGNDEKSQEYFDKALTQYNSALEIKPDFNDAIYSVGALYYNKAAAKTKIMNNLSLKEAKKFDAMKVEVIALFDQSLPYFQKSEINNPNDINTLIALKEIFARKDDYVTSGEFKKRLEVVQGGGTNDSSYFKNK